MECIYFSFLSIIINIYFALAEVILMSIHGIHKENIYWDILFA